MNGYHQTQISVNPMLSIPCPLSTFIRELAFSNQRVRLKPPRMIAPSEAIVSPPRVIFYGLTIISSRDKSILNDWERTGKCNPTRRISQTDVWHRCTRRGNNISAAASSGDGFLTVVIRVWYRRRVGGWARRKKGRTGPVSVNVESLWMLASGATSGRAVG